MDVTALGYQRRDAQPSLMHTMLIRSDGGLPAHTNPRDRRAITPRPDNTCAFDHGLMLIQ